jgi:cardiolipin synthase
MTRGALLTLPNAVSLSRVAIAPLFLVLPDTLARVLLIAVAAATDLLDGWLARRRHAVTRLGALVDPIADRVFVLAVVLAYLLDGALSWSATLLLLSRDIATTIGFAVARLLRSLRTATLAARLPGKVVTVLQMATLLAVLLAPRAVPVFVGAVAVASVVAIADYTRVLWLARAR